VALRSMTAYCRVAKNFPSFELSCELHSVNKKTFDLTLNLPLEFLPFDMLMRKMISEKIDRGTITATVRAKFLGDGASHIILDEPLFMQAHSQLQRLAKKLKAPPISLETTLLLCKDLSFVSCEPKNGKEAQYKKALQGLFGDAIKQLLAMKEREGKLIGEAIEGYLKQLEKVHEAISKLEGSVLKRYRGKLIDFAKSLTPALALSEERICQEVALVAEKCDITEELLRLKMGIAHGYELLEGKESKGKTLEFVFQELFREINTIGSKSADSAISALVISGKSLIEKMKEQIQNVE